MSSSASASSFSFIMPPASTTTTSTTTASATVSTTSSVTTATNKNTSNTCNATYMSSPPYIQFNNSSSNSNNNHSDDDTTARQQQASPRMSQQDDNGDAVMVEAEEITATTTSAHRQHGVSLSNSFDEQHHQYHQQQDPVLVVDTTGELLDCIEDCDWPAVLQRCTTIHHHKNMSSKIKKFDGIHSTNSISTDEFQHQEAQQHIMMVAAQTKRHHDHRTPLHVACELNAPAVVVRALLRAWPRARTAVGASDMTPLHIACSSPHASASVVRVLLEAEQTTEAETPRNNNNNDPAGISISTAKTTTLQTNYCYSSNMRDVDGDTPLHAACRCGAPLSVLQLLVQANPSAVHLRDKEGLTPLLRLWVRVLCLLETTTTSNTSGAASNNASTTNNTASTTPQTGSASNKRDDRDQSGNDSYVLEAKIRRVEDLPDTLGDAWNCTELLLYVAHFGCLQQDTAQHPFHHQQQQTLQSSSLGSSASTSITATMMNANNYSLLHCAAAVDCPRSVVQLAARLYPDQLLSLAGNKDANGLTVLHIAAQAPVYRVHDLSSSKESSANDDDDDYSYDYDAHENNELSDNRDRTTTNDDDNSASASYSVTTATLIEQPSVLELLCREAPPHAARISDPLGRLPLHLALGATTTTMTTVTASHHGTNNATSTTTRPYTRTWDKDGLSHLVQLYPEAVTIINPTNRLFPFMEAASAATVTDPKKTQKKSTDCNTQDRHQIGTIYRLLRLQPAVLQVLWERRKQH